MTETPASAKASRRLLSSAMPGADYGVFLMAAPLIGAAALLTTALATHSLAGFVWLLFLTTVVTALMAVLEVVQAPAAWETESPLKDVLRWSGLIALLWPVGYPLYLRERKRYKLDDWMKAALVVDALFVAGAVAAAVITVTGYGTPPPSTAQVEKDPELLVADPHWFPDADDIDVVKTGRLDNCPGKTLEQEVNGFFEAPRWSAGATKGGAEDFVNVSGILTYQDKPAAAVLQFVMNKDKSGFRPYLFTINGVPQPLYVTAFTLAQMCN